MLVEAQRIMPGRVLIVGRMKGDLERLLLDVVRWTRRFRSQRTICHRPWEDVLRRAEIWVSHAELMVE